MTDLMHGVRRGSGTGVHTRTPLGRKDGVGVVERRCCRSTENDRHRRDSQYDKGSFSGISAECPPNSSSARGLKSGWVPECPYGWRKFVVEYHDNGHEPDNQTPCINMGVRNGRTKAGLTTEATNAHRRGFCFWSMVCLPN